MIQIFKIPDFHSKIIIHTFTLASVGVIVCIEKSVVLPQRVRGLFLMTTLPDVMAAWTRITSINAAIISITVLVGRIILLLRPSLIWWSL